MFLLLNLDYCFYYTHTAKLTNYLFDISFFYDIICYQIHGDTNEKKSLATQEMKKMLRIFIGQNLLQR